jgi:hypothetical protein
MPVDTYEITLIVVAGVLLTGFGWQLRASAAVRPRAVREAARQAGLAVTPEVEPLLVARLRAQTRATLVGTIIAVIVGASALLALSSSDSVMVASFLMVVLTGFGASIGNAVAESRSALQPLGDRPRLARTPTPAFADYVSLQERLLPPVTLSVSAAALVGLALLVVANPGGAFSGAGLVTVWLPGAALWVIALASALVGRVLTGRILSHGQPATTDVELAWSDALRSRTLAAFAQTPTIGALCGVAAVLLAVGSAASTETNVGQAISFAAHSTVAAIAVALAFLALWGVLAPRVPHYLVRLWPEVAAQLRSQSPAATAGLAQS